MQDIPFKDVNERIAFHLAELKTALRELPPQELVAWLCRIFYLTPPGCAVGIYPARGRYGIYDPELGVILLASDAGIRSCLHEFRHHLQWEMSRLTNKASREQDAQAFEEWLTFEPTEYHQVLWSLKFSPDVHQLIKLVFKHGPMGYREIQDLTGWSRYKCYWVASHMSVFDKTKKGREVKISLTPVGERVANVLSQRSEQS